MDLAIEEARKTPCADVPVGCLIVKDGEIVGRGHNTRETEGSALGHAEIAAIDAACQALGSWRLTGCTLYVTLEPCPMCMGAILSARVDRVVFGAYDLKAGSCGSLFDLNGQGYPHRPEVLGGIRELKCAELLRAFFARLREEKNTGDFYKIP